MKSSCFWLDLLHFFIEWFIFSWRFDTKNSTISCFICFCASQIESWMKDKLQTASEASYRETSNLLQKQQKHQTFEAELAANKGQLDHVLRAGQTLLTSTPRSRETVEARLKDVEELWKFLFDMSNNKGQRLMEAIQRQSFEKNVGDLESWINEVETTLASKVSISYSYSGFWGFPKTKSDHEIKSFAQILRAFKSYGCLEKWWSRTKIIAADRLKCKLKLKERIHFAHSILNSIAWGKSWARCLARQFAQPFPLVCGEILVRNSPLEAVRKIWNMAARVSVLSEVIISVK